MNDIELQKKFDSIFKNYKKYVAASTNKLYYRYTLININKYRKKKSFDLLKKNIIEYNFKVRRRLGYIEDSFFLK